MNEPKQKRPRTRAAIADRRRASKKNAAHPHPSSNSVPITSENVPASPCANLRGAGAGLRRTVPGWRPKIRLWIMSNGFHCGRSALHQSIADNIRNSAGDWRMTANKTRQATIRGWNWSAENRAERVSDEASLRPCWRMKLCFVVKHVDPFSTIGSFDFGANRFFSRRPPEIP